MMSVLIEIALKSLLLSGLTLGLLTLMRRRSAAERSWVAHIGLLALVIMAFAPLVLPTVPVEAPALFGPARAEQAKVDVAPVAPATITRTHFSTPTSTTGPTTAARPSRLSISPAAAASAIYAIPAAILLLVTLIALARLITLRARAEVLVDGHWLSALARAQRRMGFKHGTALLTSNELASPISWGLMRPVILLNTRAVEASGEAEAIIAHELAHVARMDWAKLLLARIATALFWFNPLVWLLAREAHQLREEAADDSVLAADIPDTDYAQLLVGAARHECPGLLLGAHGVAPSKSSLARRVARVLDGKSMRGPAAGTFAVGVFVGAVLIAAPLAALTLTPGGPRLASPATPAAAKGHYADYVTPREAPADLPHIIASGVSTSVATAAAAIARVTPPPPRPASPFQAVAANGNSVVTSKGVTIASAADGASVVVYPPNARGLSRVVATAANGATAVSYADPAEVAGMTADRAERRAQRNAVDRAVELKAVGATPEYVASIRAVAPQLRLSSEDIVDLKGAGVTPEFVQELAREGYADVSAEDITGAYAVGVRPEYIRAMAAAGYGRLALSKLTEMRAVGVMPSDVERFRRAGFDHLDVDQLVEAKALGLSPEEIRASRER